MMDEAMKSVETVLTLYKKDEINAQQAHDLLSGIYRSALHEIKEKSKTFEYFPSSNTTSTTWNG